MKPDLLNEVWEFAQARYSQLGHTADCTVSDIILVAKLYDKGSYDTRVCCNSSFAKLYNAFANYKALEFSRLGKDPCE